MPKRDFTVQLLLLLLTLVLGTVAYLTRHPEAAVVRAAAEWPLIGPWAAWWSDAFSPAPPTLESAEPRPAGPIYIIEGPAEYEPLEVDLELIEAHPWVWVPEGTPVREAADSGAEAFHRTEALTNLAMLDRNGDWFRVLVGRRRGWVHLPGYAEDDGSPPLGRETDPPAPLSGRPPRPEAVAGARELFSGEVVETRIGPYATLTDLEDVTALALYDRLASDLESVYAARFGLRPVGEPAELIALYERQEDYVALRERTRRISRLPASGHVGNGMVAIFQGDHSPETAAGTLMHELVHLLNRRSLGPALPPWLDEGLADEVGQSEIDPEGRLRPGRLGGEATRSGDRIAFTGGRAAVMQLLEAADRGELLPLARLMALDWQEFVASESRSLHYAQSSFFFRFLLGGGDPELTDGLRRFLADVAMGGPADAEALQSRLGAPWEELEVRFRAWVRLTADGVEEVGGS